MVGEQAVRSTLGTTPMGLQVSRLRIVPFLDIIALLVLSFFCVVVALVWQHYLECKTDFPPVIRTSILTRRRGRLALVCFVIVRAFLRMALVLCIADYNILVYLDECLRRVSMVDNSVLYAFHRPQSFGICCEISYLLNHNYRRLTESCLRIQLHFLPGPIVLVYQRMEYSTKYLTS